MRKPRKRRDYYDLRFVSCQPDGTWPLKVFYYYRMRGSVLGGWNETKEFSSVKIAMGEADYFELAADRQLGGRMWSDLMWRLRHFAHELRNYATRNKILEMSGRQQVSP